MKLLVTAPRGKMGSLIARFAMERNDVTLACTVGPKGRDYIGEDAGIVSGSGKEFHVPVSDDLESVIESCDGIVDFSSITMSLETLKLAVAYKKRLVCGTTGFSQEEFKQFHEASNSIPLLYAANTSPIVNVMNYLLEITAKLIGNHTDIEILEMHDRLKKDAPSGTALEMGEHIARALGKTQKEMAVYGRQGKAPRLKGTIGYHSLRAGDISSSHTVLFGSMGERLEITHHAYSMECFAKGACDCAIFLEDKEPGFYTAKDVFTRIPTR